jgi:hypothetical protein
MGASAALVLDDAHRVPPGEPGASGEGLIKPAAAQPLAEIRELVTESYRILAPKKLTALLD